MVVEATSDEALQQMVQQSERPVVIDFYADWCGPCKRLAPQLEALANELPGVLFLKANVDRVPAMQGALKISSLPTIVYVSGGNVVDRTVGANLNEIRAKAQALVA